MKKRYNITPLKLRPFLLPYIATGVALSAVSQLQFYLVGGNAAHLHLFDVHTLWLVSLAVSSSTFAAPLLFWALTIYEISESAVTVLVFPFARTRVQISNIVSLRMNRTPVDRLLGTFTVLFLSKQGKVLLRWPFVRLTESRRGRLRRISLLLSSVSARERTGDLNESSTASW